MIAWIIMAFNWIIKGVGLGTNAVFSLLPDSPFLDAQAPPDSIDLGYVTWLIPFPTFLGHLTILLGCVAIYYSARVFARWVKLINS